MQIYNRICFYSFMVLTGLLLAICFHFYLASKFLGLTYPWNTFLFNPLDRFNDWRNSVYSAASMDPYFKNGIAVSAYFPFAYVIFLLGSFFSKAGSLLVYFISSISLLSFAVCLFWQQQIKPHIKNLHQARTSFALLMVSTWLSYPAIFSLDRGNIDIYIAALCLIYVSVLRTPYRLWGSLALGIAVSLKGYPAAFLLLALVDRDYLSLLLTVLIALALTLSALFYFDGGFAHNWSGFMHGLSAYREMYVIGLYSILFSADPYNGLRILFMVLTDSPLSASAGLFLLTIYNSASALFSLMCVFFVLFVPAPRWRRVMAVCLLATLFPNVVTDYKLLILLPGLFALFAVQTDFKYSKTALLCLALLMVPKHYFHYYDFSISGIISPILLLLLAVNVFNYKIAWKRSFMLLRRRFWWYLFPLFSSKLMGWAHKTKFLISLPHKMQKVLPL